MHGEIGPDGPAGLWPVLPGMSELFAAFLRMKVVCILLSVFAGVLNALVLGCFL